MIRHAAFIFLMVLSFCFSSLATGDNGLLSLFGSKDNLSSLLADSKDLSAESDGRVNQGVVNVSAVELRIIKPKGLIFKGKVEVVADYKISFTKDGLLKYVACVGDYVFSRIIDNNGNIIRKGSAIALLDENRLKRDAEAAESRLKLTEMGYAYVKKMTKAQENLASKNIITPFELETAKISLFSSLLDYKTSAFETDQLIFANKDPNIYSTGSGMVSEVLVSPGDIVSKGDSAVKILQMDPIVVKVKCPIDLLELKHKKETALVYPVGINKPISVMINIKEDDLSYLYVNVPNKVVVSEKLTSKQKKLAKVFSIYPVKDYMNPNIESFYSSLKEYHNKRTPVLVVPQKSIRNDNAGHFVYKVKNISSHGKIEKIPRFFQIEKVAVKLRGFSTNLCYGVEDTQKVTWVESVGNLHSGDIVIGSAQHGLKDGDEVVRMSFFWMFYPGQNVKVKIPKLTRPGIYVQLDAIVHQDAGENFVYLVQNGVAKLKKVNVIGFYDKYCLISGPEIRPGERAIILDDNNLFSLLYDGRKVKVIETKEAPLFMENIHATDFRTIDASEFSSGDDKDMFNLNNKGMGGDIGTLMKLKMLNSM